MKYASEKEKNKENEEEKEEVIPMKTNRITLKNIPILILAVFGILSGLSVIGINCSLITSNYLTLVFVLIAGLLVSYAEVLR